MKRHAHASRSFAAAMLGMLVVLSGVAGAAHAAPFSLRSPAFGDGGTIPAVYTCDGQDVSPPLRWDEPPPGTRSLALIMDDPDAPNPAAPKMTWVHWVLYDLPPAAGELPEGAASGDLPSGTRLGRNSWGRPGYGGPCPPIGRHRYFHKLYALDTMLPVLDVPTKAELERAMKGHVLEKTELVGTYQHR